MAVARRKFGGSVKESDFLYEFPCSVCEKAGTNVEGVKFCADCEENLCVTCLANHNKFPLMRGHKVLDQVQTIQGQAKQLPSQRCSKHGGKIIDVFCPEHDTVGCSTCISVDHSSCKGKTFIPDVAAGFKTSQELKQLETDMKTLMSKLGALQKLKGENQTRLEQDRDVLKKAIQSIRKKMDEQLDKMENELLAEADTKFKEKIDAIHTSIAEIDDVLAKMKKAMKQMTGDINDADTFVSAKIITRDISEEWHPMHERLTGADDSKHSLKLHNLDDIQLMIDWKRKFAAITEKYTILEVEYVEDICIRDNTDTVVSGVHSMCALPDGCLGLADYSNKKLKKFDPISKATSTMLDLTDNPVGLCIVDYTRLAVALINRKMIQFVMLSDETTLGKSFSVRDRCKGLAYCDGLLYVCCGGSRKADNKEGPGSVDVYNCAGELLRSLFEDFGCPYYISVINDGYTTTLTTAGRYKGVQVRGSDGVIKRRYPTAIECKLPLCHIGIDQLCVGEHSTGNIYVHNRTKKRILVDNKNLKGKPKCLYFDKRASLLYVVVDFNDSNCIMKVFELNT